MRQGACKRWEGDVTWLFRLCTKHAGSRDTAAEPIPNTEPQQARLRDSGQQVVVGTVFRNQGGTGRLSLLKGLGQLHLAQARAPAVHKNLENRQERLCHRRNLHKNQIAQARAPTVHENLGERSILTELLHFSIFDEELSLGSFYLPLGPVASACGLKKIGLDDLLFAHHSSARARK
jgi:hypothetical protein